MRRGRTVVAALAASVCAGAAAAEDFTWRATVRLERPDGLAVVQATPALYAGVAHADLADVRVQNGAGERVPHAVTRPAAPAAGVPTLVPVAIFPLYAAPGIEAGTLSVRIEQRAGGAIVGVEGAQRSDARPRLAGYLVDASAFDGTIEALHIDWDGSGFVGRVRVESSDDLVRWALRAADAPLMALAHQGQTLAARRVPLPGTKARYLRISWPATQDTPAFRALHAEPATSRPEPPRIWQRLAATPGERGEHALDLLGQPPVDRLRIELPMNAVLPVELLSRPDPAQPWRPVAAATLYRLERGGALVAQEEIAFGPRGHRYWLVRVDPRAGLTATLHASAGYVPHEVVFAARGDAPFTVLFGAENAPAAALPIATLVPGYREDAPLEATRGVLEEPQRVARPASRWPAWLDAERIDGRRLALWGVLVLGVAALALLAWRLARQSS